MFWRRARARETVQQGETELRKAVREADEQGGDPVETVLSLSTSALEWEVGA